MMKTIIKIMVVTFVSKQVDANLINGSFENFPVNQNQSQVFYDTQYSGWKSTNGFINVWGNLHMGVPAYDGSRYIMLSENIGIFQELESQNPSIFEWNFAFRPRANTDTLLFAIIDNGKDGKYKTLDDYTLYSDRISYQLPFWQQKYGIIHTFGNPITISFYSENVNSGNFGNNMIGSYIDNVNGSFTGIPGPATFSLLLFGYLIGFRRRR